MFHSYVELPEVISFFWVCIPTILMLVFKVPKYVVCSTLNFWCIPIFACKLGSFQGESLPGTTSCETIEWSVSTCCSKFLGSIRLFLSAISYGRTQFLLWLVQQWSLRNEHIWHLFVACFALRPPHDHVVKRCIWLGLRKLCHYAPAILRGAEDRRVFFSRGLVIAWHLVLSTTSLLDYAFDIPMSPLTCAGPARCGRNFTVEPEPTNNGKWKWQEIPLK